MPHSALVRIRIPCLLATLQDVEEIPDVDGAEAPASQLGDQDVREGAPDHGHGVGPGARGGDADGGENARPLGAHDVAVLQQIWVQRHHLLRQAEGRQTLPPAEEHAVFERLAAAAALEEVLAGGLDEEDAAVGEDAVPSAGEFDCGHLVRAALRPVGRQAKAVGAVWRQQADVEEGAREAEAFGRPPLVVRRPQRPHRLLVLGV
mmetsp:Transcript_128056/g.410368  ORF Transcript_128056/g.410368 Transcript_128056/m.410368 type:complete len:205 (+) Transcript_128056:28-642(+)